MRQVEIERSADLGGEFRQGWPDDFRGLLDLGGTRSRALRVDVYVVEDLPGDVFFQPHRVEDGIQEVAVADGNRARKARDARHQDIDVRGPALNVDEGHALAIHDLLGVGQGPQNRERGHIHDVQREARIRHGLEQGVHQGLLRGHQDDLLLHRAILFDFVQHVVADVDVVDGERDVALGLELDDLGKF